MARSSPADLSIEDLSSRDQSDASDLDRPQPAARRDGESRTAAPIGVTQKLTIVPPGARLWGFVRRTSDGREKNPNLTEQDISLWLDQDRYRFLIAMEKTVMDDLAPIEFVQFVRKFQYSTTQVLFKLGTRFDGAVGRTCRVWARRRNTDPINLSGLRY